MSRSKIVDSTYTSADNGKNKQIYWQQWLDDKNENQDLGYNVSRKIRQLYDKNVKMVKINQGRMETHLKELEDVKRILKELGFNKNNLGWNYDRKLRQRIAEINAGFPEKDVINHLEMAIDDLRKTVKTIKEPGTNG